MNILPYFQGLTISAGLIIAIGAQNAFVLKQGLKHQYVFLSASICSLIDIVLIALGVLGFGTLLSFHPLWIELARWFGAIFLLLYGGKALFNVFKKETLDVARIHEKTSSAKLVVLALLAFSLLNPHVYLDTVILLGSLAAQHPPEERLLFALGAMTSSILWFFFLAYGARILSPFFKNPIAWKILDLIIMIIMWGISLSLVWPDIQNILLKSAH